MEDVLEGLSAICGEMTRSVDSGDTSAAQVNGWLGRMSVLYRAASEAEMDELMAKVVPDHSSSAVH